MKEQENVIPFTVVKFAIDGDVEAMNYILKHFERYIVSLSQRTLSDSLGGTYIHVDQEIKRRLEMKLMMSILKFEIEVA